MDLGLILTIGLWLYNRSKQQGGGGGGGGGDGAHPWPGGEWIEVVPSKLTAEEESRAADMRALLTPGTFKDETVYLPDRTVTRRFYMMPDGVTILVYKPNPNPPPQ